MGGTLTIVSSFLVFEHLPLLPVPLYYVRPVLGPHDDGAQIEISLTLREKEWSTPHLVSDLTDHGGGTSPEPRGRNPK